jgi:hypothetical protein
LVPAPTLIVALALTAQKRSVVDTARQQTPGAVSRARRL